MKSVLWITIFIPVVLVSCQSLTDLNGTTQQCGIHTCPFWSTCNNQTGEPQCGTCMEGFMRNGTDCIDRDECTFLGYDPCARFGTGVCVNKIEGFNCSCLVGWTGPRCQVLDKNVTASDRGCLPGYINHVFNDSYGKCKDIDECSNSSTNTCGLHQHCVNTAGSYKCDCDSGWHGSNCTEDTDECKTPSPCNSHQHCVNNLGSFHCDCYSGWEGSDCINDTNECTNSNVCYIHQHCINTVGSYQCGCDNGWTGSNCDIDIDECKTTHNCTGLKIKCMNDPGGYHCECIKGWDGENCTVNVNECANTSICGPQEYCTNTDGGYRCDCNIGWEGVNCTDIDECLDASSCGHPQLCVNTDGSFRCDCFTGLEGVNCSVDIDECTNAHICEPHQQCVNSIGSYRCDCRIGWEGDNCSIDIDECTQSSICGKHQRCVNSVGSFFCQEGTTNISTATTKYVSAIYQNQATGTTSDGFRPSSVDHKNNLDGYQMHIVQSSEHVRTNLDDQHETKLNVVLGSVFGTIAFISGFVVALIAYRKFSQKNKVASKKENTIMESDGNGLARVFIIDKNGRFKPALSHNIQ